MGGKDLKFSFIFEIRNKILAEIHNLQSFKKYLTQTLVFM